MATISSILNSVDCSLTSTYGTGQEGCEMFFKNVSSLWLTPRGFKFDGASTLDETYAQQLQAEQKLVVLKGVVAFTDNKEDLVTETYDDGSKQVVRKGKYEFLVEFVNGVYYQAALNSLNGYEKWDISLVDSENNILGTLAADGSHKGFSTTMTQVAPYTWATGSAGSKQGFIVQFQDPNELDDTYSFIAGKNLAPFKPKNLDGANEVVLSYTSTPANLATSITVKAVIKQGTVPFSGLVFGDFLLTKDGATANPTADDSEATGTGIYVLTVGALATNEVLAIRLYDNSNNRAGIVKDSKVYKSNIATATVV